jgi:hypothetical protein
MKRIPGFFEVDDNGIVQLFNLQRSVNLANTNFIKNTGSHKTMSIEMKI